MREARTNGHNSSMDVVDTSLHPVSASREKLPPRQGYDEEQVQNKYKKPRIYWRKR